MVGTDSLSVPMRETRSGRTAQQAVAPYHFRNSWHDSGGGK